MPSIFHKGESRRMLSAHARASARTHIDRSAHTRSSNHRLQGRDLVNDEQTQTKKAILAWQSRHARERCSHAFSMQTRRRANKTTRESNLVRISERAVYSVRNCGLLPFLCFRDGNNLARRQEMGKWGRWWGEGVSQRLRFHSGMPQGGPPALCLRTPEHRTGRAWSRRPRAYARARRRRAARVHSPRTLGPHATTAVHRCA